MVFRFLVDSHGFAVVDVRVACDPKPVKGFECGKGLPLPLFGTMIETSCLFTAMGQVKPLLTGQRNGKEQRELTILETLFAGGVAGAARYCGRRENVNSFAGGCRGPGRRPGLSRPGGQASTTRPLENERRIAEFCCCCTQS